MTTEGTGHWIIEFDYRADEGPRRIGPFDTKEDAELWLLALDIGDFECSLAELVTP